MTVYVDDAYIPHKVWNKYTRRWVESDGWCHLTADTQEELHAFARKLGLRRAYFQEGTPRGDGSPSPFWHYDVTRGKRWQAVRLGAAEITQRASVRLALERAGRSAAAAASKPATAAPKLPPGTVCARTHGGRPPTPEDLGIIAEFAAELARRARHWPNGASPADD